MNNPLIFQCSPKGLRSISTRIALNRQLSQLVAVVTVLILFLASFITLVSSDLIDKQIRIPWNLYLTKRYHLINNMFIQFDHVYQVETLTNWCLYRHLCDLPGLFSKIDELIRINHKFSIYTKLYVIHTYYYMVGKRRFSALKWYLVCGNWLRIEATGVI